MKVALFVTCLADQFFADAAADAVRLLRSLGVEVVFPEDQTCCGQPAYNAGYHRDARAMAEHTRRVFADAEYVVLPSGSCTAMVRAFYPHLARGESDREDSRPHRSADALAGDRADARAHEDAHEDAAAWKALGERSYELAEFLVKVLGVERLGRGLAGMRIAYHHGCHALRELGLEGAAPALLHGAGATVEAWEADRECCGFGGLFSVKFPEVSAAMADRKLDTLPPADVLTSGDAGCLLQLSGRLRRRETTRDAALPVRHLASLLWQGRAGR
jgi:L-lactate dehydrogenase complex protein LldE